MSEMSWPSAGLVPGPSVTLQGKWRLAHEPETANVAQVMKAHGVSRGTVYKWVKRGKVKAVKTPGGSLRIYVESLWRPARLD